MLTLVFQLIAEGSSKLSSVPSGGAAVSAGGASAGAAAGGAAAAEAAEEKKEEEKVCVGFLTPQRILTMLFCRRSPTTTWASVSSTKSLRTLYHVSITMYCLSSRRFWEHDHTRCGT